MILRESLVSWPLCDLYIYNFSTVVSSVFRLIVIAEREVVYNTFPIPLINRLEKHFLVTSTSLRADQMELVEKLKTWANAFAKVNGRSR